MFGKKEPDMLKIFSRDESWPVETREKILKLSKVYFVVS